MACKSSCVQWRKNNAIKPVFSDDWPQMAKSNGSHVCLHVCNAPLGCWPNWNARPRGQTQTLENLVLVLRALVLYPTGWCWCCLLRRRLMLHAEHLRYG